MIGQPEGQNYDFGGMQFGQQQQQQQSGGFGSINRTGPLAQLMGTVGGPSMNLQQLMQGNPMTGMQLPGMSFGEGEEGSLPGILKELGNDEEPSILEHDDEYIQQQAQAKVMRTLGPMMQGGQMGGLQFSPPGGFEEQTQAPESGPVESQQQGFEPGDLTGMAMNGGEASGF